MSTVRKAASEDRFEIVDDAGVVAGRAHYVEVAGSRVFFHTTVDDAHAGQGLGRELVVAALDATRDEGLHVMPVCPFVAKVVAGDQRWDDVVVTVTQDALAAIQARTQR
ncbi:MULTISPECIES: GNAT family N-acetyltransferase [unclassified Agrococcus]|uniref:GNAT family N-acetyltransferase n=1 Tax=unclassified Agrococcus TaxID=2615065 RepID=UPI003621DCDA